MGSPTLYLFYSTNTIANGQIDTWDLRIWITFFIFFFFFLHRIESTHLPIDLGMRFKCSLCYKCSFQWPKSSFFFCLTWDANRMRRVDSHIVSQYESNNVIEMHYVSSFVWLYVWPCLLVIFSIWTIIFESYQILTRFSISVDIGHWLLPMEWENIFLKDECGVFGKFAFELRQIQCQHKRFNTLFYSNIFFCSVFVFWVVFFFIPSHLDGRTTFWLNSQFSSHILYRFILLLFVFRIPNCV